MFGRSFPLFRIFGFSVKADLSWLLIAGLVTWSLAGVFSRTYPQLEPAAWWWMGALGALGLFLSIVVHELAHSLVARRFGMEMRGITLFLFGGVAEMNEEPPSPKAEFFMAAVGPLTSLALAGAAYLAIAAAGSNGWMASAAGVLGYLAAINVVLALFNLVPAFPLDGGRMARSVLWALRGNLRWATRVTSAIGSAFGVLLMIYGGYRFIMQDYVGGMWMFLIGMFLRKAAEQSYQQLLVRRLLEGEPVAQLMQTQVHAVPPQATVRELVDDYIYRYHHKMLPVVDQGRLLGCVTTRDVAKLPREQWDASTVQQVAEACSAENTIRPDADAMDALQKMSRNGTSRLIVTDNGHIQGILSLKDVMRHVALKMEVEAA